MDDNPWFVRTGSGLTTSIRPCAVQGWLLSLAYAVAVTLLANAAAHAGAGWAPFVAMILSLSGLYLAAVWRLSAFAPGSGDGE